MNEQVIGDLFAEATRQMTGSSSREFSQKFAELIVRECIDACANGWQGEFTAAGISQCVSDLKEHFGVEE